MSLDAQNTAADRRRDVERYLESEGRRIAQSGSVRSSDERDAHYAAYGVAIWMIAALLEGGDSAELARADFAKRQQSSKAETRETLIVLHGDAEALGVQQKPTEYVRIDDSKPTVERSNEPFEAPQA